MLRRPLLILAAAWAVGVLVPASRTEAQFLGGGNGFDPFNVYFGYYLPHQAYIAAQPTALDTINQVTAARQYTALTDRAGLYDPISPYGSDDSDPLRPYSPTRGGERLARPHSFANSSTNSQGTGPALYYHRTARYHPTLRTGRGPNRNLAAVRTSRGLAGGMSGGGSFAGPR